MMEYMADEINDTLPLKCLGITCDNTSNNDVMIDELIDMLLNFVGQANHCRCFLHIVNLIAKMRNPRLTMQKESC
jgi:hypothetical protein